MSGLDNQQIGDRMASAPLQIVQNGSEKNFEASVEYGFPEFWDLYPRKEARKDAMKAWGQVVTPDIIPTVLAALVDWRRVWAHRGDHRFTPLAASWLRGERFYDELPAEFRQRPSSQAPAKPVEVGAKTEMPESVRNALARIRNGGK